MKQIFIAGTFALMNGASAHPEMPPAIAVPSAMSAKHQHAKTAGDMHAVSEAGTAQGLAVGIPGKSANVARTVSVDMTDAMRFFPASVNVKRGETVRFIGKNSGKLKHEHHENHIENSAWLHDCRGPSRLGFSWRPRPYDAHSGNQNG
ncbi:MAG: hypothetical protein H7176_00910 [Bdellovibrionales bacterium]|nr:hypothetical protein [Massilia sp.]